MTSFSSLYFSILFMNCFSVFAIFTPDLVQSVLKSNLNPLFDSKRKFEHSKHSLKNPMSLLKPASKLILSKSLQSLIDSQQVAFDPYKVPKGDVAVDRPISVTEEKNNPGEAIEKPYDLPAATNIPGSTSDNKLPTSLEALVVPSPRHGAVFIFDWDDTAYPTHWIGQEVYMFVRGQKPLKKGIYKIFLEKINIIDQIFTKIFIEAHKRADRVVLVTKAWKGWLGRCFKYMPIFKSLHEKLNIETHHSVGNSVLDKTQAFHAIIEKYEQDFNSPPKLLVSIGDGVPEKQALESIHQAYPQSIKCFGLKLRERSQGHAMSRNDFVASMDGFINQMKLVLDTIVRGWDLVKEEEYGLRVFDVLRKAYVVIKKAQML